MAQLRQLRPGGFSLRILPMPAGPDTKSATTEHPPNSIDLWIVEDNDGFRSMLARALNRIEAIHCEQSFGSCEAALEEFAQGNAPRVLLLDINLPGITGLEAIRQIKEHSSRTEIIMLTINDDHASIMQAICSGATGYLLKTATLQEIHQSINEVMAGGAPMSPQIARSVMGLFTRFAPVQNDYGLTNREKEVLKLLVEGFIKKEVADKLNLSYHTIDKHVRAIYSKLQVHSLSAAVAKAVKDRLF